MTHGNDVAGISQHGELFQVSRKRKRINLHKEISLSNILYYVIYSIYNIYIYQAASILNAALCIKSKKAEGISSFILSFLTYKTVSNFKANL